MTSNREFGEMGVLGATLWTEDCLQEMQTKKMVGREGKRKKQAVMKINHKK